MRNDSQLAGANDAAVSNQKIILPNRDPLVTVLMSVYNAERYVTQAVESILGQTSNNFELLIIDDASTDATLDVLRHYQDDRIRIMQNERNLGLTISLNKGLRGAKGDYVARIDADDFSMPRRLEIQSEFLDAHPQVGLIGSWFYLVNELEGTSRLIKTPVTSRDLKQQMLYGWDFQHSTIMFRKEVIDKLGPYNSDYILAQDKELYLRVAEHYEIATIPIPLVTVRIISSSLSQSHRLRQKQFEIRARSEALSRRLSGASHLCVTIETHGRHYAYLGYNAFSAGEFSASSKYFQEAFVIYPELCEEVPSIVHNMIDIAYQRWLSVQESVDPWLAARTEADNLITVLQSSMPKAGFYADLRRNPRGTFYITLAFGSHQQNRLWLIPKSCFTGVINNPRWLFNLGMWSILGEALIGKKVMNLLRNLFSVFQSVILGE